MLVPAITKKQELEEAFKNILYTRKLMYFNGCVENFPHEIKTESDLFNFAILSKELELIGYIDFRLNLYDSKVFNFGLIKFCDGYEMTIASAIIEVIKYIQGLRPHKIDFRCVADNPAAFGYIKIMNLFSLQYYTNKITLHDVFKDLVGNYHDMLIFEFIRKENNNYVYHRN